MLKKINPNKRGEFQLAEQAQNDVKEIYLYVSEKSLNAADKLLTDLFDKFQLLADNAELGRTRNEFLLNLRSFPFKKYIIFYLPNATGIEIFRVIHSARNIEGIFDTFFDDLGLL